MTYQQALDLLICPNCRKKLYKVEQDTDGINTIIKFGHQHEDFCEDIIEASYYEDSKNGYYFLYLQALYQKLNTGNVNEKDNRSTNQIPMAY